jgi:hypothetical protein
LGKYHYVNFPKPHFSRKVLYRRVTAPAFDRWRRSTNSFACWIGEALHPPFFIFYFLEIHEQAHRQEAVGIEIHQTDL